MKESTAMFLAMTGLVTTLFGVGGVENSIETLALVQGLAVAIAGLAIMACGVLGLRNK